MTAREQVATGIAVVVIAALATFVGNCKPSTDPKTAKAQEDFCKLRALYVVTTGGQFDAPAGSARARLEAAEDAFCATLKK